MLNPTTGRPDAGPIHDMEPGDGALAPDEPARAAPSGEDEANAPARPLPGPRHPFLVARRGAIFHGVGRAPIELPRDRAAFGGPEATALAPARRPRVVVRPRCLAGPDATLRAAVVDNAAVRRAADDLVARMTAPTGTRGLWRRLFAKEPQAPMRRLVTELVDAVRDTARKHRGSTPLGEQALLRDLLRARFQELDAPARQRWLRRVTDGQGTFAREWGAQSRHVRAMPSQHSSDSSYVRACTADGLFREMKQLAPDMVDHPPMLRPPMLRPPTAPPPKPPRLPTPELSEEREMKALLASHAGAIDRLWGDAVSRPGWADRLPWRRRKAALARESGLLARCHGVGNSLVEALTRSGKSAEAARLLVEAWCTKAFAEAYKRSSPRERRQWERSVAGMSSAIGASLDDDPRDPASTMAAASVMAAMASAVRIGRDRARTT